MPPQSTASPLLANTAAKRVRSSIKAARTSLWYSGKYADNKSGGDGDHQCRHPAPAGVLEAHVLGNPEPTIASGRQEMLENIINEFI